MAKRGWAELGRAVLSLRMTAGFTDTNRWAEEVGRSTRMLLGLERGEVVGPRTLALVEGALGLEPGWCYRYMEGTEDVVPGADASAYVADRDPTDDRSPGISDEELLDRINRARAEFDELERLIRERSVEGPA